MVRVSTVLLLVISCWYQTDCSNAGPVNLKTAYIVIGFGSQNPEFVRNQKILAKRVMENVHSGPEMQKVLLGIPMGNQTTGLIEVKGDYSSAIDSIPRTAASDGGIDLRKFFKQINDDRMKYVIVMFMEKPYDAQRNLGDLMDVMDNSLSKSLLQRRQVELITYLMDGDMEKVEAALEKLRNRPVAESIKFINVKDVASAPVNIRESPVIYKSTHIIIGFGSRNPEFVRKQKILAKRLIRNMNVAPGFRKVALGVSMGKANQVLFEVKGKFDPAIDSVYNSEGSDGINLLGFFFFAAKAIEKETDKKYVLLLFMDGTMDVPADLDNVLEGSLKKSLTGSDSEMVTYLLGNMAYMKRIKLSLLKLKDRPVDQSVRIFDVKDANVNAAPVNIIGYSGRPQRKIG